MIIKQRVAEAKSLRGRLQRSFRLSVVQIIRLSVVICFSVTRDKFSLSFHFRRNDCVRQFVEESARVTSFCYILTKSREVKQPTSFKVTGAIICGSAIRTQSTSRSPRVLAQAHTTRSAVRSTENSQQDISSTSIPGSFSFLPPGCAL